MTVLPAFIQASVGRDMVKHYVFNQPKREASGTDNACHLGGAVAGLALGLAMKAASEGGGGGGGVGGGMLLEGIVDAGECDCSQLCHCDVTECVVQLHVDGEMYNNFKKC